MSVFADSSALVKLYADEAGHQEIRHLATLAVSQIVRVEVPAALWRKQRMGELDAGEAQLLVEEFEADYFGAEGDHPRFATVALTADLLDTAARLCAGHGLRACDGVQLSAASATRTADPGCTTFAAFDGTLRAAAAAEGFALFPRTH
ncbi:MAG: type II toxin-antitoxin system VapC family toxin [Acidimicrobiales bacterium]